MELQIPFGFTFLLFALFGTIIGVSLAKKQFKNL